MPARSKVDLLPEAVRIELEQKLIGGGFAGYEDLAGWLQANGYDISKSGLHRWGSAFEERCASLKVATDQAKAIVTASGDDQGAMGQSLVTLMQHKIFTAMQDLELDPESIDPNKIGRVIADLSRASVTQHKHAAEVRKQAREELLTEQKAQLATIVKEGGISEETAQTFRRQILGVH